MQKRSVKKTVRPAQHQNRQPGQEWKMNPRPQFYDPSIPVTQKLQDKVAIITGGDSGIGRAVSMLFAQSGARVAVIYLDETTDAKDTARFIEAETGQPCMLIKTDIRRESNCVNAVRRVVKQFGRVDVLVNNAGIHFPQDDIQKISSAQLENTFRTNVFSMFYLSKAVLPYMKRGSAIINTASVTAYRGSGHLVDYAATKGAIVSFTRSLSSSLAEKGIRVNGVAPGPIWTPLIPASFTAREVASFGSDVPLKRAGETSEVAPCYLFLASEDSSYMTGQFLHPNGGEIVNG
jgi:NAD(P)-dependent dehydrogenase (short-subunit alcohol dehydrogenase family)